MYENEIAIAIKASIRAGDYLRERKSISVDSQIGRDVKLSADKESESIILNILRETGIPILSEESGFIGDTGERYWIVDPLDGTMNYLRGLTDLSCVSIALWEKGLPRIGVINQFSTGQLFHGIVDVGAYCNGISVYPSSVKKTDEAIIATGFPVARNYSDKSLSQFVKLVQNFKKVRMLGSAALMGVYIATGTLDAYFEEGIMHWDVAASMAIVKAAGGAVSYEPLDKYKCICGLFATQELLDDYKRFNSFV